MRVLETARTVLTLAGVLALGSCGERRDSIYAEGWNAGYEEGLAAGRTDAEVAHQTRWGWVGLGVGGLIGAALVAFATRKHLSDQWRRRRRKKEIARLVGSCKTDLEVELHDQVMDIARKKAALQDRLERDDGPLVAALADRLRPEFLRFDTQLLAIAALLQQLRELRREAVATGQPPALPINRSAPADDSLDELREQRRVEVQKNAENIARCENQLAGLAAFLDELTMRLGNLKTLEQADAFDRFELDLGKELDAFATAFERTLARLTYDNEPGLP